ncbi:MAG: hypothetical protein GY906_07700 [bacterium]|nr:hypothetical protein [bacterium]
MAHTYNTKRVAETIAKIVSPYVGAAMGQSAGSFFLKRLGLTAEEITPDEFESVLKELKKGLKVFIGQGKTEEVAGEVSRAMKTGGVK